MSFFKDRLPKRAHSSSTMAGMKDDHSDDGPSANQSMPLTAKITEISKKDLVEKIQALERKLERERKYNAVLSTQNDELSRELASWRGSLCRVSVAVQTDAPVQWYPASTVDGVAEWKSQTEGQGGSIADSVKSFLTEKSDELQRKDFVYNEGMGMYVNHTNGMMYDGKRYLYYDYQKNVYMFYDAESGTYKEDETRKPKKKSKSKKISSIKECDEENVAVSSSEEGEVDDEKSVESPDPVLPCVRMIVYGSTAAGITRGDLYIATCDRTFTFGRDPKREMRLEEDLVSKYHALISFDEDTSTYRLQDFGSQNGTFINSRRLSASKEVSGKCELTHQDLIKIGSTTLIVHIHQGLETCDDCEPGVVLARAQPVSVEPNIAGAGVSSTTLKDLHKQRNLEIKKKYGLSKEPYLAPTVTVVPDYVDRSKIRKRMVGSDHPSTEKSAAPASVHVSITEDNKGFKMLREMGWAEGEGLNSKRKADSITEPIAPFIRVNETAGLGADSAGEKLSMDDVRLRQQNEKWIKTAKRYHGLPTYTPAEKLQASSDPSGSKSGNIQWVRGGLANLPENST